jgi:hypothetical protein
LYPKLESIIHKKRFLLVLKISIVLLACFYIIHKLSSDLKIISLLKYRFDWRLSIFYFGVCIVLMVFNWLVESFKWKILVKRFERINFVVAIKSVMFGLTTSIFTPYRLGEYIGRPMMISEQNRVQAVLATFIGSLAQNATTICMGLIGLSICTIKKSFQNSIIHQNLALIFSILILTFFFILYVYFNPKAFLNLAQKFKLSNGWSEKISFIGNYKIPQLSIFLLLSVLRYLIFFSQFFILLIAFDVHVSSVDAFSSISLSYIFLFSIPGLPIAEHGLRGSLALYFIGQYSNNDIGILSASIGLWMINLAIPSIMGGIFIFKNKTKPKNSNTSSKYTCD